MSTHHIIDAIASPLSAAGAGITSVVGTAVVIAGQVPAPAGLPPEVTYAIVALGPSAIWAVFFGWKMKRAYHRRRAQLALRRMQALEAAGVPITSDDYEAAWQLFEKHSSWEAVTSTEPETPPPALLTKRRAP